MSEDYESAHDAQLAQMTQAFTGLAGAAQGLMLGLDRYEYALVAPDELNEYGADRWRIVPVGPLQEITQTLAGPAGTVKFVMERQVLVADTPAEAGGLRGIDFNGYFPEADDAHSP